MIIVSESTGKHQSSVKSGFVLEELVRKSGEPESNYSPFSDFIIILLCIRSPKGDVAHSATSLSPQPAEVIHNNKTHAKHMTEESLGCKIEKNKKIM